VTSRIPYIARRRMLWIVAALILSGVLTGLYVQRAQPVYRVSAALSVDEPVGGALPDNVDAEDYAEQTISARHAQALEQVDLGPILARSDTGGSLRRFITPIVRAGELRRRLTVTVTDASLVEGVADEPDVVSTVFTISAVDSDERIASESLDALLAAYASTDVGMATADIDERLAATDDQIDQRMARVDAIEAELAELRTQNPETAESSSGAAERDAALAQSELAQLEAQLQALQTRSVAIDDALRDLDPRGALQRLAWSAGTISSERLIALQTLAAIQRGRAQPGDTDLARLESEELKVRSALEAEANGIMDRLAAAQAEYERLQTIHSLDYPDVVRMANTVSGLETAAANIGTVGLTGSEIRNIENLAREERQLEAELTRLRAGRDIARASALEIQSRVAQTPILRDRIEQLRVDLSIAEADLAAALDERETLELERGLIVRRSQPPLLLSNPPYPPELVATSRSSTIIAVGALLGLLFTIALVLVVERVDRRVIGSRTIVSISGKRPLAEIPSF
jgi:uncharacterized protein involved in exopolysaccharide biosynthesis